VEAAHLSARRDRHFVLFVAATGCSRFGVQHLDI